MKWKEIDGFWSEENAKEYQRLMEPLKNGSKVIEIGSFRGRSICSVSELIRRKHLEVWCIDLFDRVEYYETLVTEKKKGMLNDFRENLDKFDLTRNVGILALSSLDAAETIRDADFVFIDADHSYEMVNKDIKAWWPKVKDGGILAGHDYDLPDVKRALDENFKTVEVNGNIWSVKK